MVIIKDEFLYYRLQCAIVSMTSPNLIRTGIFWLLYAAAPWVLWFLSKSCSIWQSRCKVKITVIRYWGKHSVNKIILSLSRTSSASSRNYYFPPASFSALPVAPNLPRGPPPQAIGTTPMRHVIVVASKKSLPIPTLSLRLLIRASTVLETSIDWPNRCI
jgi:hypothetical protein